MPSSADLVRQAIDISTPYRPLRVAVVTETYPPEVNGVALTIERIVHGLLERGHRVQLVRPRQGIGDGARQHGDGIDELLVAGARIPRYPELRMGLPCAGRLRRAWAAERPDVVHIVTEGPLGLSALLAARRLSLPLVSDFRTNFHAYSRHYGIGWLYAPLMTYLRRFHNATACTMVPTEGLRSELAAAGMRGLRVVARGVDTRRFDPAHRSAALRASWGAGPRTMVAMYVGRLAPEKNLGLLVSAFETMQHEGPALRLVVVGDGPERLKLLQRCPRAHFAGTQRGDALAVHYASADVFIFPSSTETFGNVVPEAMASGLALLAYDHAAAGELVRHGRSGLLAPTGDSGTFCAMARRLAGEIELARELGAQARLAACDLDWRRIVDAVVDAYNDAIDARSGGTDTVWQDTQPSTHAGRDASALRPGPSTVTMAAATVVAEA